MRWSAIFLVVCIQWGAIQAVSDYIEDKDFHWRGELPASRSVDYLAPGEQHQRPRSVWSGRMKQVSWSPRAYVLHRFLTDEECDHIIALASRAMSKSSVVDSDTGGSVDSNVRTSWGTFLSLQQDEIVAAIEHRIATITMLPVENGESLQVLRYVDGQKYEPHADYFHDKFNADPAHGGQRLATLLMYLSTPEEGGETVFPYAETKPDYGEGWSECAKAGLSVKAIKGNAVLFFSQKPDGTVDPASTHGACPVTKGVKWSAPKWLHGSPVNRGVSIHRGPKGCVDLHPSCEEWSIWGECEKNPGWMLENCRKACKKCDPAPTRSAALGRRGVA